MPAPSVSIDHDQPAATPTRPARLSVADHMVNFIIASFGALDMTCQAKQLGTRHHQYSPSKVLRLLIACKATSIFSGRRIETLTFENVP